MGHKAKEFTKIVGCPLWVIRGLRPASGPLPLYSLTATIPTGPLIWPRREATECHIYREATECHIYNVGLNIFVLIEFEIVAAFQNLQLLRKTHALLVRCGEGSVSCGCRAAVRRAGRYSVGVGTNRQGLRYPGTAAAAPKAATLAANPRANTVLMGAITPLVAPCYPISSPHPASVEFCSNRGANPQY